MWKIWKACCEQRSNNQFFYRDLKQLLAKTSTDRNRYIFYTGYNVFTKNKIANHNKFQTKSFKDNIHQNFAFENVIIWKSKYKNNSSNQKYANIFAWYSSHTMQHSQSMKDWIQRELSADNSFYERKIATQSGNSFQYRQHTMNTNKWVTNDPPTIIPYIIMNHYIGI